MRKLSKYIKRTPLMDIRVKYEAETFRFNLFEELVIDENKLNTELKEQPSYYGFLGLLLVRLQRTKDDNEAELSKKEAQLYIAFKTELNPNTHRENSNDLAQALVIADESYQKLLSKLNKIKEDVGIIKQCVSSFEQRSSLLQSISANHRKTN